MPQYLELSFQGYFLSTDPAKLDLKTIHQFLAYESYWAQGIPMAEVKKSIEHSLNFGIYQGESQVGFARIISDYATIAYLGDVFILEEHRGLGLSKWLMKAIMNHPDLQGLRRWVLLTSTAAELYKRYGFTQLPKPEIYMEKYDPHVYQRHQNQPPLKPPRGIMDDCTNE
ncbi:GNAT family N-acetyltransferase [Pontibacter sp. G13]|uniref:GNAT family N-acetyltransferase n=1 Tax=Pontibacter sp. G13 TaxID=3074898 RepID=UPI0028893440|nr:GNAT family N-acetyltransferase [Pontibacter sp. G13]WNJ18673.1 GNAT family N-acetyltransferase [Pontibacter sp. G13]